MAADFVAVCQLKRGDEIQVLGGADARILELEARHLSARDVVLGCNKSSSIRL